MKQNYYFIFGVIILLGVLFISGCARVDGGGMRTKTAVSIYETNQNIDSDAIAQQTFNENFDVIIDSTKKLLENGTVGKYFFSGLTISCIENNEILSDEIKFERRAYQKDGKGFGSFWYGNFDKEQYTFKVYVIDKGEKWKEENGEIYTSTTVCKASLEQGSINEETGEFYCRSGIVQSWKLSYNLKYILDSEGIVYLAGEYCPKISSLTV